MRLLLAIRVFFALLFGRKLPRDAIPVALLPAEAVSPSDTREESIGSIGSIDSDFHRSAPRGAGGAAQESAQESARASAQSAELAELRQTVAELESELSSLRATKRPSDEAPAPRKEGPRPEAVAVTTIGLLQSQGRLLDFLAEDITQYSDADVGAAVREIHRDLKKTVEEHFKVEPVRTEAEEALVTVPEGYDPVEMRLVGNVVGKPPFSGTLRHKGWRAREVRLPQIPIENAKLVVVPAEVEV